MTEAEKRKARAKCRKCTLAGRDTPDTYKHKSGTCPYDVAEEALIIVSSDDDDDDERLRDDDDVPLAN